VVSNVAILSNDFLFEIKHLIRGVRRSFLVEVDKLAQLWFSIPLDMKRFRMWICFHGSVMVSSMTKTKM
jgi:hypothetical protein